MEYYKQTALRRLLVKETTAEFLKNHNIPDIKGFLDSTQSPSSFTFRHEMSPAKNQGELGACTSFAVVSALDIFHGGVDLSEAHLQHDTEMTLGDCTEGGCGLSGAPV